MSKMNNKNKKLKHTYVSYNDEDIEKIFNALNKDLTTNTLSKKEVYAGLSKLNIPPDTIKQIFKKLDVKKDNCISFSELKVYVKKQEVKLRDLFHKIDIDNDGIISNNEMRISLKEYYPDNHFSESAIHALVKRMDNNNDGVVDYPEWREFLLFIPEVNLEYLMEWGGETSALLTNIQDALPIQLKT
jgi:solute carrier family 25 phosphate transporter 23/24/25/41